MKKSLILVIQILTEIILLFSSAIIIYVLFTGDGVFTIGPIVVSSHEFIRPLVILIVACVLRKMVTGHFQHGFFTVILLQWGWTQICRLTERWARSSQFRRQVLLGLVVFILLAIGMHWLRSAVTIERGLVGRYYANPNFGGKPKVIALDAEPQLFRARTLWKELYSIEWTGAVYITTPGKYEFLIGSDDGSALYIGEQLVVDNWGSHGLRERSGIIKLQRGFAPLRIRYYQRAKTTALRVSWKVPGQTRHQILPGTALFPEQPTFKAFFLERLVAVGWIGIQAVGILGLVIIVCAEVIRRKRSRSVETVYVRKAWRWVNRVFGAVFLSRIFRLMNGENRWFGCKHSSWVLHGIILLLFSLLIIYNNLGGRSMEGADEKIHTRVANTIVNTGNWWNLEYHGKPYAQKPPLKIWLSAVTFRYIGNTEFWVRFWDATFALGTMCAVYVFGRKWRNPLTGLLSALILCLSLNYIDNHTARAGVQDSAMIFFFTLSLVLFWFRERGTCYYYLAGVAMACSSLTKLWMGVGALIIMAGYLLLAGKFKEVWRKDFLIMALISMLLPLAWLIPNVLSDPSFFRSAVAENIVGRITGTRHSAFAQKAPWYFYVAVLYQHYQPWVLFLPFGLSYGVYQSFMKKARGSLLLVVWSIVVFGGFSIAQLRLSWYINPAFPAFALLIGSFFYAILQGGYRKFKAQAPFLITCLFVGLGYLFADTTIAMYHIVTQKRETYPIQNFVVYLENNMQTTPYYVVLYHTDMNTDVKDQEHYYLNRIRERVVHFDTPGSLQDFLAQTDTPTFVLVQNSDLKTSTFFKEHELTLPLPISDGPDKWMVIYHYTLPDDFPLTAKQQ
ncbi:glycosyl transferase, family 39 [Candidatus Vecturithrix granuli]|uniref:Glycosyl transferase, family 39 n=1 Tax=Vecturithrix granuli TaxID=1499967 RepID=A0A081C8U5_VECG1|nr:glycosyl transferase, family 39 [Candidatus Vecturithrix granuli]